MGMGEIRHIGPIARLNGLMIHKTEGPGDRERQVPVIDKKDKKGKKGFQDILERRMELMELKERAKHNDALIEDFLNRGILEIDKNSVKFTEFGYARNAKVIDPEYMTTVKGKMDDEEITFIIWNSGNAPTFYNARYVHSQRKSGEFIISGKLRTKLVGK
ncbi:MAG: hypothetical protein V1672_05385 [Candidatus Diapherotrites archaeon]